MGGDEARAETSDAAFVAMRALFEGEPATIERLAVACERSSTVIRLRATAERWVAPESEESASERLKRAVERVMKEVEAIGDAAEGEGQALDKSRIDAVWSMIRTLEKVDAFAREQAKEEQTSRDGELADILDRIDRRIIELARGYAAWLVETGAFAEGSMAHGR
ncbi:MAG: hypothetical protein INR68_04440 [Methylobacterium mesophilicum]|nr:hypothetical protein [Methylobacterium mesophilicum]